MSAHRLSGTLSHHVQPAGGSVYQEYGILQFAGLNNKYAPMHIADNEASDLMNVVFDELGAITKRNGYTALNATAIDSNPITSLFPYYQSNGTRTLLATSGTSIYKWAGSAWSAIKTGLQASGARFTATTYYDKFYMLNGNATDGLMQWDGTNFSTVVGAPAGQYVVLHKNRLYIAGDPGNPSRLYMSDLGTPSSWPGLNFIDVDTNDGDRITGLIEYMDSLVIFKERSLWVLKGTGPQNYSLLNMHADQGCISHWSAVATHNVLFFLARNGVWEFDGKHVRLMSDNISGSVFGYNGLASWNQTDLSLSAGVDYNNKYWLAVTEGSSNFTNNRIYAYDYIHGIWTRFDIPASCFTLFEASNGTFTLYSGDPTQGIAYTQDTGGNDNGSAINAYLTSKAFDFGAPAHYKSYKGLFFYAAQQIQGYSINVSYIADFGRNTKTVSMNLGAGSTSQWGNAVWGTSPWGAKPNVAAHTTNVSGQSRYLQFSVQGNAADQPFVFYGWVIAVNVKRRLR